MSSRLNASGPLKIRAPQRFIAGIVLLLVCAFVLWAVRNLDQGTVKLMGPGLFPRTLAILFGLSGAVLVTLSILREGEALQSWSFRGLFLVTAGILLFAFTIREFGLAVAGTLALAVSGFATPEARPREVLIFAVVMTLACVVLFRYLLGMSIPVLVIPGTEIRY